MRFWERPKKEILLPLLFDENANEIARMRIRLFLKKGKLRDYTVQLEYKIGGDWKEVLRYNYAHGFAHRDIHSIGGKKWKEDLGGASDLNMFVQMAKKDISENFEEYIRNFQSGKKWKPK